MGPFSKCVLRRALLCALLLAAPLAARAQTGVSSDRVSLPDGPGSIGGIGENVDVEGNMGQMRYQVPFEVPAGYDGMTPQVALSYSSGAGAGLAGIGWELATDSIERMTSKGLPAYTADDLFASGGSLELVQVSASGGDRVYRARREGGFVRYTWHAAGAEGYWTAESPDGKVSYFGADSTGTLVPTARVSGTQGTFRYLLVSVVDPWGHELRYGYAKKTAAALPDSIGWVFENGAPRYQVKFDYESRPDALSDCKPGFEVRITQRLKAIRLLTRGVVVQRLQLSYESEATSGGGSRIQRIERYGRDGSLHPVVLTLGYSRSLGGVCTGQDCAEPSLVQMGNALGFSFARGSATLVDVNGDSLPDLVDTYSTGAHQWFLNRYKSPTDHTFGAAQSSLVGTGSTHYLAAGSVDVLDVDGDGFADLINTKTGNVLENKGKGDWTRMYSLFQNAGTLPDLDADLDPSDGTLQSVRFMDYDNDKRIDMVKSNGAANLNQTTVWRNTPNGFVVDTSVQPIGLGFESDRLQLADMNGDGLLDPVQLQAGSLRYRLNLGRGQWGDWVDIVGLPFTEAEIPKVELEDLNNDGLDDLVVVTASEVRYALNRNGARFDASVTVTHAAGNVGLPLRTSDTTVLFADMNGSGSADVVWISATGLVKYLELFPVQPNLLSRIENGLGMVVDITYGTSVQQQALDAGEGRTWKYRIPTPMAVVTEVDTWERINQVHEIMHYRYHDPYFDGAEKQFRGYAEVVSQNDADASEEAGLTDTTYDVGESDVYRAGLTLETHLVTGTRPLQIVRQTFAECPLDGLPASGLRVPIRMVCNTATETVHQEGRPAAEWITERLERTYDGWGNVVKESDLGVTQAGGGTCGPCGADGVYGAACGPQCLGDEKYTETTYVPLSGTNGRWITGAAKTIRHSGRAGSTLFGEMVISYDGEPFLGLDGATLTRGAVTKVEQRLVQGGPLVAINRLARDQHGNVIEAIGPNGSLQTTDEQRVVSTYDALGLQLLSDDQLLKDRHGQPYRLRMDTTWDDVWNKPAEQSQGMIVRGGQVVSVRQKARVAYDAFARPVARWDEGDADATPTAEFRYVLGSPVSRIEELRRSVLGGLQDTQSTKCLDGLGRDYQERTLAGPGLYIVSGFRVYNRNGSLRRVYANYTSPDAACDTQAPAATAYDDYFYDAMGRLLERRVYDAQGAIVDTQKTVYGPLWLERSDEEDTDPASPHANTPEREEVDGLGRPTLFVRRLSPTQSLTYRMTYDELGHLRSVIDPKGNEKKQTSDLVGRIVAIDDPDRGHIEIAYDAVGNVTRRVEADGRAVRFEYDSLNRVTASWLEADAANTRTEYLYDLVQDCPADRCTSVAGRLAEVTWPAEGGRGQSWNGYDATGQLVYEGIGVRGQRFELRSEYDNLGRMLRRHFPDGQEVAFSYDAAGRLKTMPGLIGGLTFDARARLQTLTLGNSTEERFTYDVRSHIASQRLLGPDGSPVVALDYTYDRVGDVLTVKDGAAVAGEPTHDAAYAYDALRRLTSAHLDAGRAGFDETLTYAYDDADNMVSKLSSLAQASAEHAGAFTFDAKHPHQLVQGAGFTLAYDAAGRVAKYGERAFNWDPYGRLVSVEEGGKTLARNVYAAKQRVLQLSQKGTLWQPTKDFEVRDGVSTVSAFYGNQRFALLRSTALAAKVLSDLAPMRVDGGSITPQPDGKISAADAWVAQAAAAGVGTLAQGTQADPVQHLLRAAAQALLVQASPRTFQVSNHTESVIATLDGQGAVLSRAHYYPYGKVRGAGASTVWGFGGKETDPTGFEDFGARLYDPVLGRWLSPDQTFEDLPTGNSRFEPAEDLSPYAFVRHNPTSLFDPTGNWAIPAVIGAAFIGGAIAGAIMGAAEAYNDAKNSAAFLHGTNEVSASCGTVFSFGVAVLKGAAAGALSGGISAVGALARLMLGGAKLMDEDEHPTHTNQARLTRSRTWAAVASSGVGVLAGILLAAGTITPIGALAVIGIAAAGLALNYIHIQLKHRNVYGKAGKWFLGTKFGRWGANLFGKPDAYVDRMVALHEAEQFGAHVGPIHDLTRNAPEFKKLRAQLKRQLTMKDMGHQAAADPKRVP